MKKFIRNARSPFDRGSSSSRLVRLQQTSIALFVKIITDTHGSRNSSLPQVIREVTFTATRISNLTEEDSNNCINLYCRSR